MIFDTLVVVLNLFKILCHLLIIYPPTKSSDIILEPSVHFVHPSTLFVRPEPHFSAYRSQADFVYIDEDFARNLIRPKFLSFIGR